ncbi:hypothetical protein EBZ37_03465, partial [bacterium]|nr:hypothetical protein [bacterium]
SRSDRCSGQPAECGDILALELETGRAHQIRAQASSRGFPLLGDVKYGARVPFHRLALHSHHLEFPHPMSGEVMKFQCPLPEELNLKTKK